jgi:hypothetical protein
VRAENLAARVERLIPRVPVRHWVLSLPRWLRARLAEDEGLAGSLARVFARAILAWLRDKARRVHGIKGSIESGGVTVVQRAGSALNLDVHVHAMVLDGVYALPAEGEPTFHPLPEPDRSDLEWIARRVRKGIAARLRKTSQWVPSLAPLQAASVEHRVATGPRVGSAVPRIRAAEPAALPSRTGRSHESGGFSIHAAPPLAGDERHRLARLARYITRPPIDPAAIEAAPGGKLRYRLKQPFADGTTHVEFSPQELVEKLLAIVPSGPSQRLAWHGVLAPAAAQRCRIVPGQLELLPRPRPDGEPTRRRERIAVDRRQPPRCPDCDVELRVVEVEQATDWIVGA